MSANMNLRKSLLIGLAICALGIGCSTQSSPALGKQSKNETSQAVSSNKAAFHDSEKSLSISNVDSDVAKLFAELLVAVKEEDVEAIRALTDSRRMFQEIERQQLFQDVPPSEKTALRIAFIASLGEGLLDEALSGGWKGLEIQHVNISEKGDQAQVTTRIGHRGDAKRVAMRFWLTRDDDRWRIFDWEVADSFLRASSYIGTTLASLRGGPDAENYQRLLYAARQIAEGNFADGQATLDEAPESTLPDFLEAGRWLLYAQTRFAEDDMKTAKRCLDAAATLNPDILAMPMQQSVCHASLGDYANSLVSVQQALDSLGGDAEIYVRIGDALASLGRSDEAAEAYRKGLDLEPNSVACLLGLSEVLPNEKAGEVGQRFGKFADQAAFFEEVIQSLLSLDRAASGEAVLSEFKTHSADVQLISYYEAELAIAREQVEEGIDGLRKLVANATNQDAKLLFESRLVQTLVSAGRPVDAYIVGTDKQAVFAYIAERLLQEENVNGLLAVAAAYEKDHPEDISVYFYKGSAHYLGENYPEAEKELAKGMSLAETESIRDRFRQFRVLASYKMGEGLKAYTDVPPSNKTFEQLADLFLAGKQAKELDQLVALHRNSNPSDAMLDVLESEAKLLAADYTGAAACIDAAIRGATDDDVKNVLGDKLLDIHLKAKTPLAGYSQTPNKDHAFRYLAERLMKDGDGEHLLKLTQTHRDQLAKQDIIEGAKSDIRLAYYEGRAKLLLEDFAGAAKVLAGGLADAADDDQREAFREQLVLARVKLGEGLKAYEEVAPQFATYNQLARLYAGEEDADKLDELVEAHSKNSPNDPTLFLWRAEVHWLKKEYEKVADVLINNRVVILSDPLNRGRFEDRLIRSLSRSKRWEDARREAKLSTSRDGDPWFEALVAAALGHVNEASDALRDCIERGYTAENFYEDEDVGLALRSTELSKLREVYPEPSVDHGAVEPDASSAKQD